MATRSVPSVSASPGQLSITEIEVPARDTTSVSASGILSVTSGGGAPAVLPFTAVSVRSDGWTLSATIGAAKDGGTYANLNNATTPGLALTVTSKSWTTAGVETTVSRTVYATAVLRNPYPNETTKQETESGANLDVIFTLSSYIYATETVTCAVAASFFTDNGTGGSTLACSAQTPSVTNNSTEAYPQPQACWLQHDLQHVKASSFSPKLFVNHAYARNGQPVRAVKFIATDTSLNTAEAIATILSTESYTASGLYSNYFTAAIDFSGLVQGQLVTIDAIIYPWVGDSYQISVSGETYPSPNLTVLKVLNDRTGAYGTTYAYVDGVGGSPAVSTNPATAAGTPYATVAAAAAALQTYNNANNGHNNTGGGIIRIPAATTITGFGSDTLDSAVTKGAVPLIIEGVNRATSVLISEATSTNNNVPDIFKIRNLTYKKAAGSIIQMQGANAVSSLLVAEDVTFDLNGNSKYSALTYQVGRKVFINCDGPDIGQYDGFSTTLSGTALMLGCSISPLSGDTFTLYNAIASSGFAIDVSNGATLSLAAPKGLCYAFNKLKANYTGTPVVKFGGLDLGSRGIAVEGNTVERYGSAGSAAAFLLSADGDVTPLVNVNMHCNTVVGERANILYQDTGSATVVKEGFVGQNVLFELNIKTDTFVTANANRTGNWAVRYGVDGGYSFYRQGSTGSDTFGPGATEWLGELAAVGSVTGTNGSPISANFTSDQSLTGGAAGNGNYKPVVVTAIPTIPAGLTRWSVDLAGTSIATDGTAYAGAVQ